MRGLLATMAGLAGVSMAVAHGAWAGTFVFAGEANGLDIVTHPVGYLGSGTTLELSICVDPTSANLSELEVPVVNVVNTWRRLAPTTGNLIQGAANELNGGQLDVESAILHELGHCLGLGHPNLASESGVSEINRNYTKSTDGTNNTYDLATGSDSVRGSPDDIRGDDDNLHYYQKNVNDPFTMHATTWDSTTYTRALADLPVGDSFAANGDRTVSTVLGLPQLTEAVMQQGAGYDEAQRTLGHDDVATLRYGMSGRDELQGTSDDYDIELTYAGQSSSCDIVLDFDNAKSGFASCETNGRFIGGSSHVRITEASIYLNTTINWYYTDVYAFCGNAEIDEGEECDDGNTADGDCCSSVCSAELSGQTCEDGDSCTEGETCDGIGSCTGATQVPPSTPCNDGDACTTGETCDVGGTCVDGAPVDCDDGLWCTGAESCDTIAGCQPGTPVMIDDGVGCTSDSCDDVLDLVVHTPGDALCDDGSWCSGVETCDALLDCQPGTPFAPQDDGLYCTDDLCDDALQQTVHVPEDTFCQNSHFCDGVEVCDPVQGCQAGTPPFEDDGVACTDFYCDERFDVVMQAPNDAYCDDGDSCTLDTCSPSLGCLTDVMDLCYEIPAASGGWRAIFGGVLALTATGLIAQRRRRDATSGGR